LLKPSQVDFTAERQFMKKQKLVVVGNGMAGIRCVEELIKLAPDLYDITVFGAEPHPNYNRILLSPVLAGEMTINDIILNPLDWYRDNAWRHQLSRHPRYRRNDRVGPAP
jgi:nitrite reductase (NADH) large subunit